MKTIGFSIKGLLAAVTLIAVGLFALMNASYVWSSVVLSLTLLLLLIALVAIVYQRGEPRSFWVGFAIFGWGYFILTHPPLGESYRPLLPTHAALETLHKVTFETLHKSVSRQVEVDPELSASPMPDIRIPTRYELRLQSSRLFNPPLFFNRIGHCLWPGCWP